MNSRIPASPEEVASLVSRLEAELARLGQLPPNSTFAIHRKRCVNRVLAILSPPEDSVEFSLPAPEAQDELSALLNSLSLL